MNPVLSVENVSKSYGSVQALQKVSFQVPEKCIFGILGPNGSGKTTLLSIILDVLKSDEGLYRWFGQPGSSEQRKKIGTLLETPNFYHYLSAYDNLKVTQNISGRGTPEELDVVLKKVKLFERRNSRFSTFSLGMKQRLAIAAALLGEPEVLVLDEPTNGLDPEGIAEIRKLIVELNGKGHTIIMASHLLDEVEKVCTHVAILKTGNLLADGSVEEIIMDEDILEAGSADLSALKSILRSYKNILSIHEQNGYLHIAFEKGTASPEEINKYCFNNGIILQHLQLKKKKLETRFFELTVN